LGGDESAWYLGLDSCLVETTFEVTIITVREQDSFEPDTRWYTVV
jgi:hypothetical protein